MGPRLQRKRHPRRWSHSAIKWPCGELPRSSQKRDSGLEVSSRAPGEGLEQGLARQAVTLGPGAGACRRTPAVQLHNPGPAWNVALEDVQGRHLLSGSHPPQQLASSEEGLFPSEGGARAKGDRIGGRPAGRIL